MIVYHPLSIPVEEIFITSTEEALVRRPPTVISRKRKKQTRVMKYLCRSKP